MILFHIVEKRYENLIIPYSKPMNSQRNPEIMPQKS
jgi:hypothetical protein